MPILGPNRPKLHIPTQSTLSKSIETLVIYFAAYANFFAAYANYFAAYAN